MDRNNTDARNGTVEDWEQKGGPFLRAKHQGELSSNRKTTETPFRENKYEQDLCWQRSDSIWARAQAYREKYLYTST